MYIHGHVEKQWIFMLRLKAHDILYKLQLIIKIS